MALLWMKYASDGVARKVFLCVEVEAGFLPVVQATTIKDRVPRRGGRVNGGYFKPQRARRITGKIGLRVTPRPLWLDPRLTRPNPLPYNKLLGTRRAVSIDIPTED